jgi:hypothetical protein
MLIPATSKQQQPQQVTEIFCEAAKQEQFFKAQSLYLAAIALKLFRRHLKSISAGNLPVRQAATKKR